MRIRSLCFLFFFLSSLLCTDLCPAKSHLEVKEYTDQTAIHTYGGGELLCKVFNAVSMLVYGNSQDKLSKTFHAILQIALAVGGFSCICLCFFREKIEFLFKCFFLPAIGILSFLLVPRTTVVIQDHLVQKVIDADKSALIEVDNVPLFLGKFASLVSTVSYYFNEALESVVHGTNDEMYNWTGHIYAAENIFLAGKCQIANKLLEDNFREFCRECVYRDIGIGLYSKDDLVRQQDLLKFLEENTSGLRTVFYRDEADGGSSGSFIPCNEAIHQMNQIFGKQQGNSREIVIGETSSDIFFLLGQKEKGKAAIQKLIKQQAAIDLLKEEMPGTLSSFASKRAEILQKENQKILGALGASSIVAMRNFFEAMIYTLFPLMIVFSLLSFGIKPLLSWTQFVLWVNTWPPFYVVVNFLLNSIWNFRKHSTWGADLGLTIFTSEGLANLYSSMESIAAVAMAFIPFLSWIVLKGGVHQMVHMASSLMSPAQNAASVASSEATSGNYSFGNISLESLNGYNAQMFKQSYSGQLSLGSVSLDAGRESSTFIPETGGFYVRQADSYLRESVSRSKAFSASVQDTLSATESSAFESSRAASDSISDTSNKAVGLTEAVSKAIQSGQTWNKQESSSFQEGYQYLSGLAEEYGQSKGITKEEALREVFSGGFSTGLGLKMLGLRGEGQASLQDGVSRSESDSILEKAMQTESFQKHMQAITNLSKSEVGNILEGEDARLHEDFTYSFNKSQSFVEQERASYSKLEALSQAKNYSNSDNVAINQKLDQQFVEFLGEKFRGDSGLVSDMLDLSMASPQKKALIDEFVEEYLPKSLVGEHAPIQEFYSDKADSFTVPSQSEFERKVAADERIRSPLLKEKWGPVKEKVDHFNRSVEVEDQTLKGEIEGKKAPLGYAPDQVEGPGSKQPIPDGEFKERKEGALQANNKTLSERGEGMVLVKGGKMVKQAGQLGADIVHKAMYYYCQDLD